MSFGYNSSPAVSLCLAKSTEISLPDSYTFSSDINPLSYRILFTSALRVILTFNSAIGTVAISSKDPGI